MLARILEFSLRQRLLIAAMTLAWIGIGLWSAVHLPIDAVPDVTNVQVQINTNAAALSPLEVERQITYPVEVSMSGLPDVQEVRSLSKFGLSQVTVVFDDSVDIYFARQLVQERLQKARQEIPPGSGTPEMGPISTGLGEIFQYTVESDQRDLSELRAIQDWDAKLQLRSVPGVAEVNSFGGREKQYQVLINPQELVKYGLTLRHVFEAVAANNLNKGGGYIVKAAEQYVIRGLGRVQTIEQIGNIVLSSHDGVPVHVHDVAEVQAGAGIRQGAVTKDGKGEVVTGIILMLLGANSRVVVENVKSRFETVRNSVPADVRLNPFYDRADLVTRTIRTVEKNLLEGALLVIAALFLLLGNIRAAIIVALAIPLSMLFAVGWMVQAGIAGSLMSLGAIDFGLVVDSSVILVENAVRHLGHAGNSGKSRLETVRDASMEVLKPSLVGQLIIMVVYLPILTLEGIEGKLFKPMALTVVFALAGSLLLSVTVIPALASFFLGGKISDRESWIIRGAKSVYQPVLDWALQRPKPVFIAALAAVLAAFLGMPFLGSEFIPRLDEGALAMQILRLPSVSLEEAILHSTLVEKHLLEKFPDEIATVVSKTGRAEIATDPMGVNISDTFIMLKPQEAWKRASSKAELEAGIAREVNCIPGLAYGFSQPIELRVNELIAGVRSDLAIKIFGEDLDILRRKADAVVAAVSKIRGAAAFKAQLIAGLPSLEIIVEPDQCARYGINAADVLEVVEALGELDVTEVFEGRRRFPLVIKFPPHLQSDKEAIANLVVSAPGGERIPLGSLARIEEAEGPAEISHENGSRLIIVEGNVRGRDIGSFVEEARRLFSEKRIALPQGYWVEFGGQFENLERARLRLAIVVPAALGLVFVLLFTAFNSLRQALLVFTGVPFAAVGGVFALLARDMPFSISAGVGFIALFGVAVLNGLVLVSSINKLRKEGQPLEESVRRGALMRLRPVLMTALVASFGFIPMAISTGSGAEVQRPLATVVIGGLISSTLLTLLILPLLYRVFERSKSHGSSGSHV